MDTFLDVTGIVKRAKQVLNFKNDSELAEYLGVSRATVSNWGARNSIDFRLLLDKFGDKVDYNWLLLGKGNPKHQPRYCESELVQGEVEIIRYYGSCEPENIVHQQKAVCTGKDINSEYFRLRRSSLRQRRQHVSYIEIGRHYRI